MLVRDLEHWKQFEKVLSEYETRSFSLIEEGPIAVCIPSCSEYLRFEGISLIFG